MENTQETQQVLTEVTSIDKEDQKTGVRTEIPSPEQLMSNAVVSIHRSREQLMNIIGQLSKKATMRVLAAIFELPAGKLPVTLRGEKEIYAFGLGQRIQSDRFIIVQHYINKEIQSRKQAELEKQETTQEASSEQQT
jgi:hypothetical protein